MDRPDGPLVDDADPAATRASTARSVDWVALSDAVVPRLLRARAIDVAVATDRDVYRPGETVHVDVTVRNRLPIPVRLRTDSPVGLTWAVDGHENASQVQSRVPDRPASVAFAGGETKRFRRQWTQRIRVSEREWTPVGPGTYVVSAGLSRADAADRGLVDRTTIEITE